MLYQLESLTLAGDGGEEIAQGIILLSADFWGVWIYLVGSFLYLFIFLFPVSGILFPVTPL